MYKKGLLPTQPLDISGKLFKALVSYGLFKSSREDKNRHHSPPLSAHENTSC